MHRGTGKPTDHLPDERAVWRVSRFMRSVRPNLTNLDRAVAEEWLPTSQMLLFLSQSEADQRHAVTVARLLLTRGYASRDLIAAALLHDVGKREARFTPWHRTAIVVLEAISPALLRWLGRRGGRPFFRPFALHQRHSQEGAALAAEAGASQRTVQLIREHHQSGGLEDEEMEMLRWADDHA